ncbi:hypothetical protein AB4289_06115 [Vibrio cyclitrophicus]
MNLTLQKKLAEIVMTAGNAQSQVTAIKALDSLGDEMDDSIFDPWINKKTGDIKNSSSEPEVTGAIFSSTPVQQDKKDELLGMINIPAKGGS